MAIQHCSQVGGKFSSADENELKALRKEVDNLRKEIEKLSELIREICSGKTETADIGKEETVQ